MGTDALYIRQPGGRSNPNPDGVNQTGTRINTTTGARTSLGMRCITPGTSSGGGPGAVPEPVVITVTQQDFASLPVQPSKAHAGPPDGWLPVNMVNILYADPNPQTLTTTILNTPVHIRAIPIEYHWDLGDGNTITTSNPGKPYPSEEISTTYVTEGWYEITLTTTFAGQYSVDGGPWEDIDGTIDITSDPVPLYSKSLESRLVGPNYTPNHDEPWIPPNTPEHQGPQHPNPQHRTI